MPIKPENRHRYPANWPEIRERIRTRSGNRCEWPGCGLPNHAIGYRKADGEFVFMPRALRDAGYKVGDVVACSDGSTLKIIRIVLTVAHVHDHNPENCGDDNLAHWCQYHHNRHDAPMRRQNAAVTRRAGNAMGDLFGAEFRSV